MQCRRQAAPAARAAALHPGGHCIRLVRLTNSRERSMRDVAGRTAFITGGGSVVGFGMAKAFTAAGMNVVIADLRQDHLDEAMSSLPRGQAHPIRVDVT